ncbi:MAG: glycosyltransferase [Deltaproteobacteria bacterium]|nr:glycosyltransferase [Deltaproteobacteria bacterium]MBW2121016.1 glycosyltransferase [Deltaproteobacteria bacterium]
MKVDVVIPVKQINSYIQESIRELSKLEYEDYRIMVLPDISNGEYFPNVSIVPTGEMGPAQKRDLALRYSTADILAFIDDDAYPRRDWIRNAVRHFDDPEVAAVGGPAVTPPGDSLLQRVSGAVFLSRFGGGNPERYRPVGKVRKVDDWPSVNLFVRRDLLGRIGGFNSTYWPGEDTKLCLDIVRMGKKIVYDPEVFIWHHRREGLMRHLRQVGRYGLHRGFFAKKYPDTSRKLKYFLPTLLVIFLASGISIPFLGNPLIARLWLGGLGVYLATLLVSFYEILRIEKSLPVALLSLPYIFLSHVWYGIRFFQGLVLVRNLASELRTGKRSQ